MRQYLYSSMEGGMHRGDAFGIHHRWVDSRIPDHSLMGSLQYRYPVLPGARCDGSHDDARIGTANL